MPFKSTETLRLRLRAHRKITETTVTETLDQLFFRLKSNRTMRYDISKSSVTMMPTLRKDRNRLKILL